MIAAARICWPLAVVLEVASREEASARVALAAALDVELRRSRQHDAVADGARADRLAWERAAAEVASGGGSGAVGLQQRARHLEWLRARAARGGEDLRRTEAALAEARRDSARRRDALVSARSAVRALELHRDAWRGSLARGRARRDDLAEDELVSAWHRAAP